MGMLQYRHKSRAWRQMVTTDESGALTPIKDRIAQGIAEATAGEADREHDLATLMERLRRSGPGSSRASTACPTTPRCGRTSSS